MAIDYKGLRIAVCDDMEADRKTLLKLLNKYLDMHGHLAVIDQYISGEALLAADISRYELVILDIYMAKLTGIHFLQHLQRICRGLLRRQCPSLSHQTCPGRQVLRRPEQLLSRPQEHPNPFL